MSSPVKIITNRDTEVKNNFKYNINKSYLNYTGGFTPGVQDRATLESDLSGTPGPSGVSSPVFYSPDGFKAINSPYELGSASNLSEYHIADSVLPKALPDAGLCSDSDSFFPSGGLVDPTVVNGDEISTQEIIARFAQHKYKLAHTPCIFLHLRNRRDWSEAIYKSDPESHSRYFPEGRANIQSSIRQRLGTEVQSGVFLTLTVAASDWDIADAWGVMWECYRKFRQALNAYRKRNMNAEHSLLYLAALEPHESGYPHMHVFYPSLRWVIKKKDLHKMDDWWGMGSVRTEKEHREESAQSYVLKYVSKLDGWSEPAMAMLWWHRLRLYNLSHRFYKQAPDPEWEVIGRYYTPEEMGKYLKLSTGDVDKIIDTWKSLVPIEPGV